jgi:hypothetical protein
MKTKKMLLIFVISIFVLIPALSVYAASYEDFFPFLIELSGWKAEKPDGADIKMAGQVSISAARKYSSGDKEFEAAILIGQMMMGAWNIGYQEGFKMETPDMMMEVKKINGFMVFNSYEKNKSSGLIMVLLNEATSEGSTGAVFSFSFVGMNGEEAVKLAQKFDWEKVKTKVEKIK